MISLPLQKLRIAYEANIPGSFAERSPITVLFNPQTLQYRYAADWKADPISGQVSNQAQHAFNFQATHPVELSFELMMDVSMEPSFNLGLGFGLDSLVNAFTFGVDGLVLRGFAKRLDALTRLVQVDQELHRPPRCKLTWGSSRLFCGVLTSLDQKLTAFTPGGAPIRAEFSCHFKAIESEAQKRMRELHSADVAKRRVVRQGDTLQSIAREAYGDPSLWRPIARENHVTHPLLLKPGMSLIIPPLE